MVVNIGAIACRGFANATTIIISQELGKDHKDTAREYGKRMLRITIIVSLIGCAIILAVRPMILDFYRDKLTETAIQRRWRFQVRNDRRFHIYVACCSSSHLPCSICFKTAACLGIFYNDPG